MKLFVSVSVNCGEDIQSLQQVFVCDRPRQWHWQ